MLMRFGCLSVRRSWMRTWTPAGESAIFKILSLFPLTRNGMVDIFMVSVMQIDPAATG